MCCHSQIPRHYTVVRTFTAAWRRGVPLEVDEIEVVTLKDTTDFLGTIWFDRDEMGVVARKDATLFLCERGRP